MHKIVVLRMGFFFFLAIDVCLIICSFVNIMLCFYNDASGYSDFFRTVSCWLFIYVYIYFVRRNCRMFGWLGRCSD
jgi:hypothetical protein